MEEKKVTDDAEEQSLSSLRREARGELVVAHSRSRAKSRGRARYEATSSRKNRSLAKEIAAAAVASVFLHTQNE
ncbi:hypothetical protein KSP40_PGU022713 [Platanthera guangdongensis]|uniref:Uncharacterized protein n=1 Tax=Platanthera guangdongensis TaxID=2320717 RepID=A0ABR2M034_9ASPA